MKRVLFGLLFCNMALANGFDVVLVNLPEENRRVALAGCETSFTDNVLSAECQQGIPTAPAEVYSDSGSPVQFDAITDNAWWWFSEIPNPEWGACRLISINQYTSYTGYTVQCVRDQIFADGFTR